MFNGRVTKLIKCLPKRRSNACSRIRKPRDAAVRERIPLSELVHEEIMNYGSSSYTGSRNASHTMVLSMLEVPNEWVNEDGGSLIAFDTTDRSHYEEMRSGVADVSVTTTALEDATRSSLVSPTLSVAGLGSTSRPDYPGYPCINDSQAYSGICTSNEKVRGKRSICSQCVAAGRGGRGRSHGSNSLLGGDRPITYTEYWCPNRDKYNCTQKVTSPRSVCSNCIAHGRPPPTYKSTSIVQDLDAMEEYVEKYVQDADHEWILPDHD